LICGLPSGFGINSFAKILWRYLRCDFLFLDSLTLLYPYLSSLMLNKHSSVIWGLLPLWPHALCLDRDFTLPKLLTSYTPSYPETGFQISFSFIEYHFLIFYCGCFGYLYDCVLPCFNQRLPIIFIRLVILFPLTGIAAKFCKIIAFLIGHI